jgi:integrase
MAERDEKALRDALVKPFEEARTTWEQKPAGKPAIESGEKTAREKTQRFVFTHKSIEKLALPAQGRAAFYDSAERDLGLRVESSGRKSFFWYRSVNGKPVFRALGVFPANTVDVARAAARKLTAQLDDYKRNGGPNPFETPEKGLTFDGALESYVKSLHAPRENRPVKDPAKAEARIRWRVGKYLAKLKPLSLEQVTVTRLEELHRSIGEAHGHIAANRALELTKAIFRHAIKRNLFTGSDPTQAVEKYSETKRDRFLQPDELVRLRQALDAEANRDLADFVELLLLTGVRKSSLYAARFEQVSEPFETWNIPTSKNGSPLSVQLTPRALAIFQQRRKRLGDGWVFPSAASESGHVMDYQRQWERLRKAAGIPDITKHDLRRTCASYQAISGASLAVVGASLGHKSLESTQVYARLHGQAVRQSLLAGEKTQRRMMEAAKRQLKAAQV